MKSPGKPTARRALLLLALLAAFALHIHRDQKVDPELAAAFEVLDVGSDAVLPPPPPAPPVAAHPRQLRTEVVTGPGGAYEVARGELLVQLRPGADPDLAEEGLRAAGARWIRLGWSNSWRVGFDTDRSVAELAEDVRSTTPGVSLRPNAITRAASCGPGDLLSAQWEQPIIKGNDACRDSWDLPDVRIAILDTGVAYEDHDVYVQVPELEGVPIVHPYDFINNDSHANDDNGHGTHLAGLIASQDRLHGHAPTPELMPIKVLDQDRMGTEFALIEGLHWAADHGAQVVNLSLVFGPGYLPSGDLIAAVNAVLTNGGVVLGAAGNGGLEQVGYPAALPGVIAVASARLKDGDDLKYVDYSNQGFAVDLSGPGGDVTRDENDDGIPDGMLAQSIHPDDPAQIDYWVMAGTSQATAVVSGQAAWALANGVPAPEVQKVLTFGRIEFSGFDAGSHDKRAQSGDGAPKSDSFEDFFPEDERAELPELFVHTVLALKGTDEKRRPQAYAQVVDASGTPVKDVEVYATFRGDAYKEVHQKTNDEGWVKLEGDEVDYKQPNPAAFFFVTIESLRIEHVDGNEYGLEPGGFFPLSEATASLVGAAAEANPGQAVVFKLDPTLYDHDDDCSPFKCGEIDTSFTARSLGGGFAGSVVSMVFNKPWLQQMGGAGFAGSVVPVSFAYPMLFSWGSSEEGSYEVWDLDGSGFAGSVVSAIPWDGSFWSIGSGFAGSVVPMLTYDAMVWGTGYGSDSVLVPDETTDLWGSGFAGSVVSPSMTYSNWTWGSGFAGSVVSMGHWSSLVFGNGFAGSVVTNWWVTPSMSAASTSSTVVGSSLGTGAVQTGL